MKENPFEEFQRHKKMAQECCDLGRKMLTDGKNE